MKLGISSHDGQKVKRLLSVLVGHIIRQDGFVSIDPSHPLGGQDGLKDLIAVKDGKRYIIASYFPKNQQRFSVIKNKFKDDLVGLESNFAKGLVFCTNQELTLGERDELINLAAPLRCEIYHLERIASILDSPPAYGVRLEYLDIDMSKEEQLAYFDWLEKKKSSEFIEEFTKQNQYLANLITGGDSIPRAQYVSAAKLRALGIHLHCDGNFPLYDLEVQRVMIYPSGQQFAYDPIHFSVINPGRGVKVDLIPFNKMEPIQEFHLQVVARNGRFFQSTILEAYENPSYPETPLYIRLEDSIYRYKGLTREKERIFHLNHQDSIPNDGKGNSLKKWEK